MKEKKQRSGPQNRSLHKYCTLLADALNNAGLDMKKTLKPEIDIPWTCENVKDHLYKPILKALTGKKSTRDMNTVEPSEVYDVLNRFISEKHGVSVEWPSEESQRMKSLDK
jgi:hypothetical protein